MLKITQTMTIVLLVVSIAVSTALGVSVKDIKQGQKIADFVTEASYLAESGVPMGARFIHEPSGFVLDLLRIQSVPQAFMWVNTFPPGNQGEPHTLEHLLLGKGTKGRYVASLEDMSLGRSSAFTDQTRTCYHFHTSAGTDVFFNLFEKKLDAMLHPNFSDEEIRREVCNMGIKLNPQDSSLDLEEKGTVYNEMFSSYERPWGNLYYVLGQLLYGKSHPQSYSAGGLPSAIRTMKPDDIRNFHTSTHHLNNMGVISAIPNDIPLESYLSTISKILKRIEPNAKRSTHPEDYQQALPKPSPAPEGTTRIVSFPHQNENEPCLMVFAWGPNRSLDLAEGILLDILIENLSDGETSILYDRFINSEKQIIDIGATSVFGWVDSEPGSAVYIGFNSVRRDATSEKMIDSVRAIVTGEIDRIASFKNGSDELEDFNRKAMNRLTSTRKQLRDMLNSPPRFGYRGTYTVWMNHLLKLHKAGGYKRSLMMADAFDKVEQMLSGKNNFWRESLSKWRIDKVTPYAVATRPNPEMIVKTEEERRSRIDDFITDLQRKNSSLTKEAAISLYKKEYDANTAKIDSQAATISMPGFIDNPPLSLDAQLDYTVEQLPGGGDLVITTFDNMTSSSTGLAFDMYVVPESLLMYLPAIPQILTGSGIVKDGRTISYDEMQESMRREILGLSAYFVNNLRTNRVELVARTRASGSNETEASLRWLNDAIINTNLHRSNLPRIRDIVDLSLGRVRNRMRGSEESWVNDPANAYWKQQNPLYLSTSSFLTQTHHLLRLRWQLKETPADGDKFARFMSVMASLASSQDKQSLSGLLASLSDSTKTDSIRSRVSSLLTALDQLSPESRELAFEVIEDLQITLGDIPDASIRADWTYLCNQITADLAVHPRTALVHIEEILVLIKQQDNVRGFIVASSDNQATIRTSLEETVSKLGETSSLHQKYASDPRILARLAARLKLKSTPLFVGLINEATRSGVHINTANCASFVEDDPKRLMKFLSARLYGGGGAHSMFMKTWGAGLAYSNGLRSNENSGRLIYYAERCPDLSQTMRFVVDQLKNADYDPSLADYAVAQAFAVARSGNRFDSRGEAMAADVADGLTPEIVARFRKGVLELQKSESLYDSLIALMPTTYGEVLPGYGVSAREAVEMDNAFYFVIGPESQMQSYESYLKTVEGDDATLYRLYPRDFWLTGGNK